MLRTSLALVLVGASATAASAGGFVGLGIGTSPATSSDISFYDRGRSGRLDLGYKFSHLGPGDASVEGLVSQADVENHYGVPFTWTSWALAGRYNLPIGYDFEVFGR